MKTRTHTKSLRYKVRTNGARGGIAVRLCAMMVSAVVVCVVRAARAAGPGFVETAAGIRDVSSTTTAAAT